MLCPVRRGAVTAANTLRRSKPAYGPISSYRYRPQLTTRRHASNGNANTAPANVPPTQAQQRISYLQFGAIAIGLFCLGSTVTYVVLTQKASGLESKDAVRTWEDVKYATHAELATAIAELKKVLPRDGAVNTVSTSSELHESVDYMILSANSYYFVVCHCNRTRRHYRRMVSLSLAIIQAARMRSSYGR